MPCALCLLVLEAAWRPLPPDARLVTALSGPANGCDGGFGWEMRDICLVFYVPNLTHSELCDVLCALLCVGRSSYARTARTSATALTKTDIGFYPRRGTASPSRQRRECPIPPSREPMARMLILSQLEKKKKRPTAEWGAVALTTARLQASRCSGLCLLALLMLCAGAHLA